jgi:hypothetical protein
MQERELVKIKSDYPGHPKGYYIGFKDQMKPEDVELIEEGEKTELTVKQIKEALAGKGISIPDGVTKKADLQALLDSAKE